jgi:long-subunit fatty acid transport protein
VVPVASGITQENTLLTKGGANEINLSVGGNYNDQFYIGGSINIPQFHYESTRTFRETNTSDPQSPLNYYDVVEDLTTDGVGFNTKVGIIYRPVAPLRVGLTYVSPTWASFTDNYITSMVTDTKDYGVNAANSTETNNGYSDESKYNVTTPMKGIASLSYIFRPAGGDMTKPSGFITADYEYMSYAAMKMKMKNGGPNDQADSEALNQAIDNTYQAASNFRVGGELKLNIFAIRAGFAYYGNPYKVEGMDGSRKFYTGGLGYRNRGLYLDVALVYGDYSRQSQPYTVLPNQENVPSPPPADIKTKVANVTATIGFKF